jgi:tRNA (cmo5U34)-methyltransferase
MGKVGDGICSKNSQWSFEDEKVVAAFDEHVSKSVPMYSEGHDLILRFSDYFTHKNSKIFEIGSSTGVFSNKIYERSKEKKVKVTGIDISEEMTKFANDKYSNDNCTFIFDDAINQDLSDSDMIVAYYTIQFINSSKRQEIINKIYDSLNWGGAFFMFEKTRGMDARFQDMITSVYYDYKISEGYSLEEIMSKHLSLKGVLEPFSTKGNIDMLKRAGFIDINTIFKFVPFEGFLAIK